MIALQIVLGIKPVSRAVARRVREQGWTFHLNTDGRGFTMLFHVDDDRHGFGGGYIEDELGERVEFADNKSLWKTWAEIHNMFGVAMADEAEDVMAMLGIKHSGSPLGIIDVARHRAYRR